MNAFTDLIPKKTGTANLKANPFADLVPGYKNEAPRTPTPESVPAPNEVKGGFLGNMLTGSTQKFGKTIGESVAAPKNAEMFAEASAGHTKLQNDLMKRIKEKREKGEDTSRLENALNEYAKDAPKLEDFTGDVINKSTGRVLGEAAGTLGEVAGFGSYGKSALLGEKAFTSGLQAAEKILPTVASELTTKIPGIGEAAAPTLKNIFQSTAKKAAVGATTGEAYDIAQNLQEGKTGTDVLTGGSGKYIGAAVPVAGGLFSATKLGGRKIAPQFINSLIGANSEFNKAVKFGNNPGATATKYGIVANNLDEFSTKLGQAKDEVGQIIGGEYNLPENLAKRENYSDIFTPLQEAITKAEKSPESNSALIKRLQGALSDLTNGKDFSNANPAEMFQLKQQLKDIMKFTGAASDDRGVNGALNGVYGKLVSKINSAIPKMASLNKDYGGLLSAELSAQTKSERELGKSLFSLPAKLGLYGASAATGIGAALTGGVSLVPMLMGLGGAGIEKAAQSTAFKTRVAKWLGGAADAEIQSVLRNKTIQEQKTITKLFNDIIEKERLERPLLPAPRSAIEKIKQTGVNTLIPNQSPIEAGYPTRPTTEGERFQNNLQQNSQRLFNTKALPAPQTIYNKPTQQGKLFTPNSTGFKTTPVVETKRGKISLKNLLNNDNII